MIPTDKDFKTNLTHFLQVLALPAFIADCGPCFFFVKQRMCKAVFHSFHLLACEIDVVQKFALRRRFIDLEEVINEFV